MKTLKVTFFDSVDEIIRKAKGKFGKHKQFGFAKFPDGSLRLVVKERKAPYRHFRNGTVNDYFPPIRLGTGLEIKRRGR